MGRRVKDIVHNIIFQVDQETAAQAVKSVDILRMSQEQLEQHTATLHESVKILNEQYRKGQLTEKEWATQNAATMQEFAKADSLLRQYQKTTSSVNDEMSKNEKQLVRTKNGVIEYRNELARVRAEAVAVSHVGMGIGALGRTAERVTGIPISGATFAGQEAFRAVRGIQLMNVELPILASKFAENKAQILGLVGGGVALLATLKFLEMAHKSYQNEVQKSLEALQRESDLRKQIAYDNLHATEEEAKANAEKAKEKLAIEQAELDRLKAKEAELVAQGGEGAGEYGEKYGSKGFLKKLQSDIREGVAEVADYIGLQDFNEEADAAAKAVENQSQKVKEAREALDLYTEAQDSATVADNTRTEALKAASEAALGSINEQINYQRDLGEALRNATPEEVNSELARLRDELGLQYDTLEMLREQHNAGIITEKDFSEAQQQAFDSIGVTITRIDDWSTKVRDAAELRKKEGEEVEADNRAFERMISTLKKMQEGFSEMGDFARDSYYIELERQKTILEQQNEYSREALQKKADHYLDMVRMDEDYYLKVANILKEQSKQSSETQKKILKVQQDFNDKDQEALREHMRKLYEIRRDAQESILDAASRLDAVAVQQAISQRDKQLDDEYYQYEEEKKQREKDRKDRIAELESEAEEKRQSYQEQLEDLEAAHELEQQRKEEDYQIAADREREEFNRKQDQQTADWEAEDTERTLHMARQAGIIKGGYDEIEQISKDGMDKFAATIKNKLDMINAVYAAKNIMKDWDIGKSLFDQGGFPAPGRMGIAGGQGPEFIKYFMPTQVIPMNMVPGGGNSKTYSFGDINIQGGMTNQDTAQAVIDAIGSILGP